MAQPTDRTEDGAAAAATGSTDENVSLLVWQNTTMLDTEMVDGVAEDNVLRGID